MLTSVLLPEDLGEVDSVVDAVLPRLGLECKGGNAFGHGRELKEVASDDELESERETGQQASSSRRTLQPTWMPPKGLPAPTFFLRALPIAASLSKRKPSTMETKRGRSALARRKSRVVHTHPHQSRAP